MTAKKRTHQIEKLARIYDGEILPVWAHRFGRMLLRGLTVPDRGQVLDVACGTGYPAVEIIRRLGPGSRLIAIDAASAMLDVARKKVEEMEGAKQKVFFRTESATPRLSFADDVYDLVVCNLGLSEMESPEAALADFARVTVPGGEVRVTLPLEGTFQEFYDIFREVLIKNDKHEAIDRLNEHLLQLPAPEVCEQWMEGAGFSDFRVDVQEFSMLFKSSREFFFAPVIEFGPLTEWKAIAGRGQEMQDIFWYIKEAIDAYFGDRAFQITVKAGCLIGTVPTVEDEDVTGRVSRIGEPPDVEEASAGLPIEVGSPIDEEIAEDDADNVDTGTEEIDISELEELEMETLDGAEPVVMEDESGIGIDAFSGEQQRPAHLEDD